MFQYVFFVAEVAASKKYDIKPYLHSLQTTVSKQRQNNYKTMLETFIISTFKWKTNWDIICKNVHIKIRLTAIFLVNKHATNWLLQTPSVLSALYSPDWLWTQLPVDVDLLEKS